jgi:hypothetical protein
LSFYFLVYQLKSNLAKSSEFSHTSELDKDNERKSKGKRMNGNQRERKTKMGSAWLPAPALDSAYPVEIDERGIGG